MQLLFALFEEFTELSERGQLHHQHDGLHPTDADQPHDVPVLQSSHHPRFLHNLRLKQTKAPDNLS